MNRFPRLVFTAGIGSILVSGAFASAAFAEPFSGQHVLVVQTPSPLLASSSQAYLGIYMRDIDSDRAPALKLKEPLGAEITMVDHDAPAAKAGLRIHDVILQMNGQPIQGVAQLQRMLHETPPGRTVTLIFSRDGQQQTLSVQLADSSTIGQDAWSQHQTIADPDSDEQAFALTAPRDHGSGNGFFGLLNFGNPSIGAQVDILGSQLADYFGVKDGQGLLVKHVAEHSPASTAGLKAGDVITKVNGQTMATLNDWLKTLHNNRGKQLQVTIFRNHKEQVLGIQDGDARHKGELMLPEIEVKPLSDEDQAQVNSGLAQLEIQVRDFDPAIISDDATQALGTIDVQKLTDDAQLAAKSIDTQKFIQQMKDEQQQIQQQMDELKKQLQSLHLQEKN